MVNSSVIGLRVRPWSLNGDYLRRADNTQIPDVWAIEKCTIETYDDGKSFLTWKSIYDFPDEEQAEIELNAMQPQLQLYPSRSSQEPAQAGDLVLLQMPGKLSGSVGLIEGVFGEFSEEFDVQLNPETFWICESNGERQIYGTGGAQYRARKDILRDTEQVIYHDFKYGYPSEKENLFVQLPVRLYTIVAADQALSGEQQVA